MPVLAIIALAVIGELLVAVVLGKAMAYADARDPGIRLPHGFDDALAAERTADDYAMASAR